MRATAPCRSRRFAGPVFSAPRAREIIISADVQRDHDTLLYACRISLDGRTLQEGPAGTIATPHGVIGSCASVRSALQEIAGFIDDSELSSASNCKRWSSR
jgi:hypothetical protein